MLCCSHQSVIIITICLICRWLLSLTCTSLNSIVLLTHWHLLLTLYLCRPTAPWYDAECHTCNKRVRALERCYSRSRLVTDHLVWSGALDEKKAMFAFKEQHYWSTKLMNCAGNSKLLWQCLNTVLLRDSSSAPSHVMVTS